MQSQTKKKQLTLTHPQTSSQGISEETASPFHGPRRTPASKTAHLRSGTTNLVRCGSHGGQATPCGYPRQAFPPPDAARPNGVVIYKGMLARCACDEPATLASSRGLLLGAGKSPGQFNSVRAMGRTSAIWTLPECGRGPWKY
jgi:hypothetical protein